MSRKSELLRKKAIEVLKQKGDTDIRNQFHSSFEELVEELSVYQVELEMQNAELLRSQQKIEQTGKKYEDLFNNAPVGYIVLDEDFRIREVNRTLCEKLGFTHAGLIGQPFSRYIHPESQDEFYIHCSSLFKEETPTSCAISLKTSTAKLVQMIISADITVENKKKSALLTMVDISTQKKTEGKLADAENKFKSFIDQSHDAILIVNDRCEIQEWNLAQEKMTGYKRDEAVGQKVWEMQWKLIPPDLRKKLRIQDIRYMFENYFETGSADWIGTSIEARILTKEGKILNIEQITFPINTQNADMIGSIIRDVSEKKQAEEALQKSEELLRVTNENLTDVVWRLNNEGVINYISPSVEKITGFKPSEIVGKSLFDFIPEKEKVLVENLMMEKISTKTNEVVELEMFKKDGDVIPLEISSSAIFDRKGLLLGFSGVSRDISARKEAEKALKDSEAKFRSFMDNFAGAAFIKDADQRLVYCNDFYASLIGKKPADIINKIHNEDDLPDNIRKQYEEENRKIAETGETFKTESVFPGPDGDSHWLTMKFPVKSDGETHLVGSLSFDITEQKQLEKALRQSEEYFKTVFNQAAIGLVLATKTGDFIKVNSRLEEITGYSESELLGMNFREITHPEDLIMEEQFLQKVLEGEADVNSYEKRYFHKSGNTVWVKLHSNVLRNENGDIRNVVAAVEDITEQKESRLKLQEKERQINFLATTAIELAKFEEEKEIWRYTAEKTREIVNNQGIVIVSEFRHEENIWAIKAITGLGNRLDKILELIGKNIFELKGKRNFEPNEYLLRNNLIEISSKYSDYTEYGISGEVLSKAFKLLRIERMYEVILTNEKKVSGFVTLIRLKDNGPFQKDLVEAFISQVSVFLRRKLAVNELEKYKGHLEELVKDRTRELEEKNDELERFNQLFIGREFRIKELKEKLELLEKEIKQFKGDENHAG